MFEYVTIYQIHIVSGRLKLDQVLHAKKLVSYIRASYFLFGMLIVSQLSFCFLHFDNLKIKHGLPSRKPSHAFSLSSNASLHHFFVARELLLLFWYHCFFVHIFENRKQVKKNATDL